MLAKSIDQNQRNWDTELQRVLFAYRVSIHDSTGFTPFLANFGRSPKLPVDVMFHNQVPDSREPLPSFVKHVQKSLAELGRTIRLNSSRSRQRRKEGVKMVGESFSVGDRVYLYIPAVPKGRTRKLASLWRGPYTIID